MSRVEQRRLEQAERDGRAAFLAGEPCEPSTGYAERDGAFMRGFRCAEREAREAGQGSLPLEEAEGG